MHFSSFPAPLTSGSRLKVLGRATICVNCHSCLIIVFIFSHTTLNLTILVYIMFCKYGCFKSCNISATCSRSFKKSQTLNHTPYANKIIYYVRIKYKHKYNVNINIYLYTYTHSHYGQQEEYESQTNGTLLLYNMADYIKFRHALQIIMRPWGSC